MMRHWKNSLKADPTDWLLEENNPSVRYFALKQLQDRPEYDPEVQLAKSQIMKTGIVPEILKKQQGLEYKEIYSRFYTAKYKGLVWQLIVLAELSATINPQIKEQCEFILENSQEIEDGGFSMHASVKNGGGRITEVIPCLTGNMVWCLIKFGYLDDPRIKKSIGWLTKFMHLNDGVMVDPQVPPYDRYEICWGKHTCHMGVVKALKAFSAISVEERSPEVNNTIAKGAEFLLIHHIYKRSHDLSKTSKPGWLRFSFPLMYQTDILEILDVLTDLGFYDDRMAEAIDVVLKKQNDSGRWQVGNTLITDRLLVPFGSKNEDSKWITLRAMRILRRYFDLKGF